MSIDRIAAVIGGDLRAPAGAAGGAQTIVEDIAFDHRAVTIAALFACVPGITSDGHDFAREAIAAGASVLLVERPLDLGVPEVVVPSVRAALGPVADLFFGHPSRDVTTIGITGTNGKTTSAFLFEGALTALGMMSGLIGTVETHLPSGEVRPAGRTTPEAFDLQRLLREMASGGADAVAMEVSSEGLDRLRVEGTWFASALFTNLTQDHLNHHGTMEAYFAAKAMLFRPTMSARAAVCIDETWGRRLAASVSQPCVTFGAADDADVSAADVTMAADGSRFVASTPMGPVEVALRLPGSFNIANALGVLAVAVGLGWDLTRTARGLGSVRRVPGRMEPVDVGQDFAVLVDYAHTPDALEGVLRAARGIAGDAGRVIAVFGCGGDRDRGKRPLMGRAGALLADVAIITSDNPRSEDPATIIAQIEDGARATGRTTTSIVDRAEAIAVAVAEARADDVVIIAGKGHESGQTFADRTIPFDDRAVARGALEDLLGGGSERAR